MREVIGVLRRNSNVKSLIDEFQKDFKDTYYRLGHEQKESMINYRDTIFRKWLYSPIREGTYLTPNYIINNIAQQIIFGNYSVMMYIKITVDNYDNLKFSTKFLYYSCDDSPVIEDLEKLVSFLSPTIIVRDENEYVIDGGKALMNSITIQSDYYIEYLIEIATRMNILESMKSIGCKCYKIDENYYKYSKLSNENKLRLIIEKSMEIASDNVSDIIEANDENFIIDFLDNGITQDTYFNRMESSLENAMNFASNISEYTDNEEEIINITIAKYMLGDKIGHWLVRREAGIYLDMNLTCIFGYYLGIINPTYEEIFLPSLFMELMDYTDDIMERVTFIFTMELGHNLTKFGEKIMRQYKENLKENNFKFIIPQNIKRYIEEYIKVKNRILEDIKRSNGSFIRNMISGNLESKYR